MDIAGIAMLLLAASVLVMMFTIGLRTRPVDSLHVMREWHQGLRAFLALFVAVPAVAVLLATQLPLPPPVAVALIALSVSPMLPTLPNDLVKLGAEHRYAISLQIVGAVAALAATPVVFWIVAQIVHVQIHVAILPLLAKLARGVFLPLGLGIAVNLAFPTPAARIAGPLVRLASPLLLAAALVILWDRRALIGAELDALVLLAIAVLVGAGLAAGHLLGGPTRSGRAALALTAASRHAGFAIAVGIAITRGRCRPWSAPSWSICCCECRWSCPMSGACGRGWRNRAAGRLQLARIAASPMMGAPEGSVLAASSQARTASRQAGHSEARIENIAESRARPFITYIDRSTPSGTKPRRRAAARDGAFSALHFHTRRR